MRSRLVYLAANSTSRTLWSLRFAAPAHSPRRFVSFLSAAGRTTTAAMGQKGLQIIAAVVIGNFIIRLDLPQRHDHNPAFATDRLGIGSAGVVDVTGHIPARRSVDHPSLVEGEHISGTARFAPVGFLGANAAATIGGDVGAALDWLGCEQAKTGH